MRWSFLSPFLLACVFVSLPVQAAPADVEGSQDYPGWERMPGFEITDYDEDNPAEFTFSVSRPSATDANHLDGVPIQGHRYVIQYAWNGSGAAPSLLKEQHHYEKLATAAGYKIEKSGKVGNATETFHLTKDDHEIWVFFSPSGHAHSLTVVETKRAPAPPTIQPPAPPQVTATTSVSPAPPVAPPPALQAPLATTITAPAGSSASVGEDPLATELIQKGRVVLPLSFLPGKPELSSDSQPVIDRVAAILTSHPDLVLTIEGHTDLTGDEDANLVLSRQRAQEVRTLLIGEKINRKRLTAVGMGGTQPVADEATAEGRQKNRRIELVVKSGTGKTTVPSRTVSHVKSVPADSATSDSPDFHAPAPDGINYYPDASKIVTPPPPAAKPN